MKPTRISGRIWVLTDPQGHLYDDVDTDMIFHNRHLHITDVGEMGQHALGNLSGWEDFAQRCEPGDLILAGANFGSGSSRQQAVDCFRSLGVAALIAESYGAIYKRNAINSGFPILSMPGLSTQAQQFRNGDTLDVDFRTGEITAGPDRSYQANPFSTVQMDIYLAGDLFRYGKTLGS
jgi:3-isopropylmalate/(R)-2-methylmalate dehydratase small subunit